MSTAQIRGVQLSTDTVGRGALMGAVSFVVGFLATWILIASEARELFGDADIPLYKKVAWFFYNAHFVNLARVGEVAGWTNAETGSLIAASDEALVELLYVVPPLALILGGFLLYRQFGPIDDPVDAALSGAFVVVGYLPLAVVGAVLTAHTLSAETPIVDVSLTVEPLLSMAVLLAGIVYPIVFGAVGGVLGSVLDSG